MKLTVINSNSFGNCYILEGNNETLILEAGVKIDQIKKTLNFDFSKVVGCLVSHCHGDHSKSIVDLHKLGVNTYSSQKTYEALSIENHYAKNIKPNESFSIGSFKVTPFLVEHDAPDTMGFVISHFEMGNLAFITDTYYCKHTFANINHFLVECNYSDEIINAKYKGDKLFLRNRIFVSHMSLDNCKNLLKSNDLSTVNEIVLIHLSDSNSNEKQFVEEVIAATGKLTYAAKPNLVLELVKP